MGNKVRGADKIDIVAPSALEFDHVPAEFIEGNLSPFSQTADRVILAEDATEVTIGHKDRSRPMTADERPLLPEMGSVGRNLRETAGPAESLFSPCSIQAALSRANRAFFQQKKGPANPFREEALLISAQVSRFEIFSLHDPHPSSSLSPDREPYAPFFIITNFQNGFITDESHS
jgi:hypothetical protein